MAPRLSVFSESAQRVLQLRQVACGRSAGVLAWLRRVIRGELVMSRPMSGGLACLVHHSDSGCVRVASVGYLMRLIGGL